MSENEGGSSEVVNITMSLSVEEANKAILVGIAEQFQSQLHGLNSMIQTMLVTRPQSKRRIERINAGLQILQSIAGFYNLFEVVMDKAQTGTAVETVAEILDEELDELNEAINRYVDAQRGDVTDTLLENPRTMGAIWREREEAAEANRKLDMLAQKVRQAEEEEGGSVEQVLISNEGITLKVHRDHPFQNASLVSLDKKLVS